MTRALQASAVPWRWVDWTFGPLVFAIGVANLLLVHPVPGVIGVLLSLVYFPPVNSAFERVAGRAIPPAVKIMLGIAVLWFTLGVSDLGDMID